MIYIASPYSHPDKSIEEHRFQMVKQYVIDCFAREETPFSPIVYCHHIATEEGLPTHAAFWQRFNNNMMRRCESVRVLQLHGWNESKGVAYEMKMAIELGIPLETVHFPYEIVPKGLTL